MMTFLSYLFAFLLIVDSLLLALLILVQLPKKEAGVGMAFGGGAADALFGAGSGTALTKMTKYCSVAFFILVIGLSYLNNEAKPSSDLELRRALERTPAEPQSAPAPATRPAAAASNAPGLSLTIGSNTVPAITSPATNTPAVPVK
jgi:preprotein translocase subunit SecG